MYHAYRLAGHRRPQSPHPHTLAGIFALDWPIEFLLNGFSSGILCNSIAFSAAYTWFPFLSVRSRDRSRLGTSRPGLMQAAAWMVCTTAAFITAPQPPNCPAPPMDGAFYAVTFCQYSRIYEPRTCVVGAIWRRPVTQSGSCLRSPRC